jgi:hypothetical protein
MNELNKEKLQKEIKGYEYLIKESNVWVEELQKLAQKYSNRPHILNEVKSLIKIEKERQDNFYKWRIEKAQAELTKYYNGN